jgi:hypothetical protein
MSQHLSTLSVGGFIALTAVPVIALAGWLIAIYQSDRHPEWRHGPRAQGPPQIPGAGVRLGRSLPGSLTIPADPASRTEDQPDEPELR